MPTPIYFFIFLHYLEARTGIEPVYVGFADRSVTTSPPGHNVAKYILDLVFNPEKHFV